MTPKEIVYFDKDTEAMLRRLCADVVAYGLSKDNEDIFAEHIICMMAAGFLQPFGMTAPSVNLTKQMKPLIDAVLSGDMLTEISGMVNEAMRDARAAKSGATQ